MSYKFNRDCWVESLEDSLSCSARPGGHPPKVREEKDGRKCLRDDGPECNRAGGVEHAGPAAVEEMIASAESLLAMWGDELRKDDRIRRLMQRLEINLENSRTRMHDSGIFQACARCDANAPEGSCCSRGLERKYTPILLLMNLILGGGLPEGRQREDSCYFLGLKGCSLKVRHMLCIDYLCPELVEALGRESLIEIQTVSGKEIETVFLLREAIKDKIRELLK